MYPLFIFGFESGPIPPIIRKGAAWPACRAVFGFIALRSKGEVGSIGDRNWFNRL